MSLLKDSQSYDKIENNDREAREYRFRVKRLLADHERFVKRRIVNEEKESKRADREELLEERKRFLEYMGRVREREEGFMNEIKVERLENLKENKKIKELEEKSNLYDDLIRSVKMWIWCHFLVRCSLCEGVGEEGSEDESDEGAV
jgi:hypothetical protein